MPHYLPSASCYVSSILYALAPPDLLFVHRYQHLGSMMALGSLNAAVQLPVSLPATLQSGLAASPAAPLLNAVGVKVAPESGT
jgi:hypothetical protein